VIYGDRDECLVVCISLFRRWWWEWDSQAQKKRAGTRVAELEAKLGKVQDELKKLRGQLASAEAAKKDAQVALEEAKKRVGTTKGSPASLRSSPSAAGVDSKKKAAVKVKKVAPEPAATEEEDESSMNSPATDVFEVIPTDSVDKENQKAVTAAECQAALAEKEVEEEKTKKMIEEETSNAAAAVAEPDAASAEKEESPEVSELKAKLTEKDAELAALTAENAELKKLAAEAAAKAEEDAATTAALVEQSLAEGEARAGEQLKASEAAREALEGEMRRLRVQTEQWRKAAEAAAAVLGGDNHLAGLHGIAGNGNGWGSPATMPDDGDDDFGGKRKGAGIRMLGDLWKKKGNKA
jgi:chromosome segregation ATPase